jgi:hypothetical protein
MPKKAPVDVAVRETGEKNKPAALPVNNAYKKCRALNPA